MYDDDMIDEMIKKIFSSESVSVEDKIKLLKLRKIYLNILKIRNYSNVEKKLYNNKSEEEKIELEIFRLLNKVNNHSKEMTGLIQAYYMERSKGVRVDYTIIYDSILDIEVNNDIDITLYNEYMRYYSSIIRKMIEYNDLDDDADYKGKTK